MNEAKNFRETIDKANDHYKRGEYHEARIALRFLLEKNLTSGEQQEVFKISTHLWAKYYGDETIIFPTCWE